jgi:hypothetical protein
MWHKKFTKNQNEFESPLPLRERTKVRGEVKNKKIKTK